MRRVLLWMHLGSGVAISAFVLFFAITGSLIAYERQIVNAADQHSWKPAQASTDAQRLSVDALVAGVAASVSSPVEMVTVHPGLASPVEIQTADRSLYFADPYSGKFAGPMSPRLRAFFAEVTSLHRWFGLGNAHHAAATVVKGAATLLLLFMLCSGAVLWLPKRWTPAALRSGITPRFDTCGRARNYNWHKVTGFWAALPLGVIVVTGVIMAYPWANSLLFRLAGSPPPAPRGNRPPDAGRSHRHGDHGPALPANLDHAFAQATAGVSNWQAATLRIIQGGGPLSFTVDQGDGGHPDQREQVFMDSSTMQVTRREPFAATSRGQRWRAWVRFTHTGEAGGVWGETLALLAALGAIALSLTGILLSLDRLRRWRRAGM